MKNNNSHILIVSIVIPTRNRMHYVSSAIKSILSIPDNNFELVVQDNSDTDVLSKWVNEHIKDHRLRYNYTENPVSMTENYNLATRMALGEYVCTIGDDDSVNPEIIEIVKWAKLNELDALSSCSGVNYFWPDFQSRLRGNSLSSKLLIATFTASVKNIDSELEMLNCVSNAGQGSLNLAKVYHGIVRKKCLDEVRMSTGSYFSGVSPDVNGALSVANYIKKACVIDYPLTISGNSGGSNSGRSAMGTHKGNLKDDPHMKAFTDLNWPILVPEFFSVQTVWAEAAIESLQSMGRKDLLSRFNFPLLHALCLFYHSDFILLILRNYYKVLDLNNINKIVGTFQLGLATVKVAWLFAKRIVLRVVSIKSETKRTELCGLNNIQDAVEALNEYLITNDISFKKQIGGALK